MRRIALVVSTTFKKIVRNNEIDTADAADVADVADAADVADVADAADAMIGCSM
jgi:hypothetical protein